MSNFSDKECKKVTEDDEAFIAGGTDHIGSALYGGGGGGEGRLELSSGAIVKGVQGSCYDLDTILEIE